MKQLEDMTYSQRVMLTLAIVLVILVALALAGWNTGRWDNSQFDLASSESSPVTLGQGTNPDVVTCISPELVDRLKAISLKSLDAAFDDQVMHLFQIWMKDAQGQPQRSKVGMAHAINGYVRARENLRTFMPPDCPTSPIGPAAR